MNLDELKFEREDCIVTGTLVDRADGTKVPPRWGSQAGNVIGKIMGPAIHNELRSVTVTHIPTNISVTIDQFMPYRNKEIAFIKVEALVNEWIENVRKAQSE